MISIDCSAHKISMPDEQTMYYELFELLSSETGEEDTSEAPVEQPKTRSKGGSERLSVLGKGRTVTLKSIERLVSFLTKAIDAARKSGMDSVVLPPLTLS
jgi:hypothetical protein